MMEFIRKHRKLSTFVMSILVIFLILSVVFARYIYNIINNYILETKHMYFYSSVLDVNGRNFSIQNWDGFEPYHFTVDLRNYKNDDRRSDVDIPYTISISCDDTKVACTTTKGSGSTLVHTVDSDSFIVDVVPKPGVTLTEDDVIKVTTTVTTTSPYKKVIYGSYNIGIEKANFSHSIEDSVGSLYTKLILKNTISVYEVKTAFTHGGVTYNVGDKVNVDTYNTLTDANKANCFSALVTLSFDTSKVKIDVTDKYFLHRLNGGGYSTTTDANGFINGFTLKMGPSSTAEILFYKDDISQNYTNNNTVITVTPELAD